MNEDKRRKETFVLNRRIQVHCDKNAVGTEANTPIVKNSKWNKYLSEEDDDDSDDSMPMSPTHLRIGGTSAVCKERTLQNYSTRGSVNICGGKIGVLPEKWKGKPDHFNDTRFNVNEDIASENEDIAPHVSESSSYFSTGNYTHDDNKSGGVNNVCELQRNSSSLCFTLLPETSTTGELLNCNNQHEILSDFSSDSFTSNTQQATFDKQLCATGIGDFSLTNSEINKQEEGKKPAQLQSPICGSFVADLSSPTINLKSNVKQIFSDKYNEDELDEILKF